MPPKLMPNMSLEQQITGLVGQSRLFVSEKEGRHGSFPLCHRGYVA
jgi:hypothetical protein